jgi:hypothetical protein
MTHLEEADLIAFALDDDEPGAHAAAADHLADCDECRSVLEELRHVLDATSALEIPVRGEQYGREVWARLEPRLRASNTRSVKTDWRWLAAAAVLLLAVGSFLAGRWSRPDQAPVPSTTLTARDAGVARQRVVLAALGDHFDRAERALVEVANADPRASVDISAEQAWARDLLEANRLYRQTARGAASPLVVDLLGELEPVLLEIVNGPSRMTAADLDALQSRIEERGLVFKLRVARSQVGARQRPALPPGEPVS